MAKIEGRPFDVLAQGVEAVAIAQDGDTTLEDLGIYTLRPGDTIIKCNGYSRLGGLWADRAKTLIEEFHASMMCCLSTGTWPVDPKYYESEMLKLGIDCWETYG